MDFSPDLPASPDEAEIITLDDGHKLTAQQSLAVYLRVAHGMSTDEIAERCGYSTGSTVRQFLRRETGKRAVEIVARSHLLEAATLGLRTMMALASKARSENVRQLAAADLMDRFGLRNEDVQGGKRPGFGPREVSININVTQPSEPSDSEARVTIEGRAE